MSWWNPLDGEFTRPSDALLARQKDLAYRFQTGNIPQRTGAARDILRASSIPGQIKEKRLYEVPVAKRIAPTVAAALALWYGGSAAYDAFGGAGAGTSAGGMAGMEGSTSIGSFPWLDSGTGVAAGGGGFANLFRGGGGGGGLFGGGLMDWANLGIGGYGLYQGAQTRKTTEEASKRADPFGPHREEYARKLAELEADPSLITKEPGYQAGLEAVQRSMAAQGYLGSGNMMAALQEYGGNFYQNAINRYAKLAGAYVDPGTSAQLQLEGQRASSAMDLNSLVFLANAMQGWGQSSSS